MVSVRIFMVTAHASAAAEFRQLRRHGFRWSVSTAPPRIPAMSLQDVSLFVAATLLLAGCDGTSERRPNVILISLDTCRADSMGFLGAARPTPELDALAEQSVVFEDCLAQSSVTAPSHLSILTGFTVQRHGLLRNGERSVPAHTLASILKALGYQTAAFTGHGSLQGKFGHGVGFQVFHSWDRGMDRSDVVGAGPGQRLLFEAVAEGLDFVDKLGDKPFFLFVHGYDPHLPYWPKEPMRSEFAGWYDGELDISDLNRRTDFHPLIEQGLLGQKEHRYLRDLYDAEILGADQTVGAFLRELDARGILEDSLVIYTSDHGELLGEHDWVGHGPFYEDVLHVPLLFRFPRGPWKGRHDDPVQHTDILPTVLSYLGIPAPAGLQGADLMPIVREGRDVLPADRMRVGRLSNEISLAFADEPGLRLLFRHTASSLEELEVYDLRSDPEQELNLAADREGKERYRPFVKRYLDWSRESEADDERYRSDLAEIQDEDKDILKALGYMGDDE